MAPWLYWLESVCLNPVCSFLHPSNRDWQQSIKQEAGDTPHHAPHDVLDWRQAPRSGTSAQPGAQNEDTVLGYHEGWSQKQSVLSKCVRSVASDVSDSLGPNGL